MPIPEFRDDGWLPEGHHPATWAEVTSRFGGSPHSRRDILLGKLLKLRDGLKVSGCAGRMLLDGSFISAKDEPADFDVLLILQPEIQQLKDSDPALTDLLDAENAEKRRGYTVLYAPESSTALPQIESIWDESDDGILKGIVQVLL